MNVLVQTRTEIERGGSLIPVDVMGIVKYKIDRRYGADADGNRGESRTIIDEVVDIHGWDDDVNEMALNNKEEDFVANILINKFLGE